MPKTNKFANEGYTLYVLGKNIEVTEAIRSYVWEKLSRIERIGEDIIDIHVTLDHQKLEHVCSIWMNFHHFHLKVQGVTDNLYSAIDKATDRIVKLIRRYKTKLHSHRAKNISAVDIHVNVIEPLKDDLKQINDEIEAENAKAEEERLKLHPVVAKDVMSLKTLTQDEAVMKLEFANDPFLIYRSEEDQKIKVLYRREDSNFGLVQIQ